MRGIIELIRKHPKIRRILRCESPYFHHWFNLLLCQTQFKDSLSADFNSSMLSGQSYHDLDPSQQ